MFTTLLLAAALFVHGASGSSDAAQQSLNDSLSAERGTGFQVDFNSTVELEDNNNVNGTTDFEDGDLHWGTNETALVTDADYSIEAEEDFEFDWNNLEYLDDNSTESDNSTEYELRRTLRAQPYYAAWKEYFARFYPRYDQDPFTKQAYRTQLIQLTGWTPVGKLTSYAGSWDEKLYGAGTNTYFMGLKRGACGYGDLVNRWTYPHMNAVGITGQLMRQLGMNGFVHGVGCGACVKVLCADPVYCPGGQTAGAAMVTDLCPDHGCAGLQADMFRGTFLLATANSPSNPGARFQRISCPDPNRNVRVAVAIYWGGWGYTKVNFMDVGAYGVITKVQMCCCTNGMGVRSGAAKVCPGGGAAECKDMKRSSGAYWETGSSNSPRGMYCDFRLFQEDGTRLMTKLTRPLPRGSADYNNGKWLAVWDSGIQFRQKMRDIMGTWVPAGGMGRRNPRGRRLLESQMNITNTVDLTEVIAGAIAQ